MSYTNEDLAATGSSQRTWKTWNFAALWISMSLCIPTYMLASSLIGGGMNWWQAIFTIFLGNLIVLVPMVLNGHAGAKYGIPFPVFARASFGVRGANIPAMLRAIVACGWFGIQTWIGGFALFQLIKVWVPAFGTLPRVFPESWGLESGPAITFLAFWFLNMFVVYLGVESIRKLLVFKAIFLPLAAAALLFWAISASHGLGPILAQPSKFESADAFWSYFFPALTGMVGFWATLSLNIPDFTRYAASQRAQMVGQAIGLPPSMTLFAFVGVAVTSATAIVFGETIWDPVVLAGRFESPFLVSFAMLAVAISTLATNIAANIVSPANDFSNLMPEKISFRAGGYMTGVIGLLIFPWKLIADPQGYIFKWLIAYSSLLGPVGGIMIADYYFVRAKQLNVPELYRADGQYWYCRGFNSASVIALLVGILPNVPGFLIEIGFLAKESSLGWAAGFYHYAWFIGFAVSGVAYWLLMRVQTGPGRNIMFKGSKWLPLLFLVSSLAQAGDLKKAPPSFTSEGRPAVFVDLQDAHYDLRYDFAAKKMIAVSTLTFVQEQAGFPLLNFEGPALTASLDGAVVPIRFIKDPAPFALLDRALAPGRHFVRIESERPFHPSNEDGSRTYYASLLDHFGFSDERSERGLYLDHYLPTNLAFDQYSMRFTVDASNSNLDLHLFMNGVTKQLGKNRWEVTTLPSYNCTSLLYSLADLSKSKVTNGEYRSVDGRMIRISVLIGPGEEGESERELASLKGYLEVLEARLAPWPYEHLLFQRNVDGGGGMEYAGAYQGGHRFHELIHSYFARGVYPVDGNAEWFDEVAATALDERSLESLPKDWTTANLPVNKVSGFSPYQQGIPVCPHDPRALRYWNQKFLASGGILPFMKHLIAKYMYQTISTEEIKAELEAFYQTDFTVDFDQAVFGKKPVKLGIFELPEPLGQTRYHPQ